MLWFYESFDGGNPCPVTPEGIGFCRISPDGQLIAANGTKMSEAQLYPVGGGAPHPISGLQSFRRGTAPASRLATFPYCCPRSMLS
jgi:hypothetical protein